MFFKHLKHRFKTEGIDWLLAMENEAEAEMETLISVPGTTKAKTEKAK